MPHYVSLAPSPKAAAALCERLGALLGAEIDTEELDEAAAAYVTQVSEAIASDEETAAYVEELERRVDELDENDLPSGETLAAELTRGLLEILEAVDREVARRFDAELEKAGFFEQSVLRHAQRLGRRTHAAARGQSARRVVGHVFELERHHVALG